jgi:hypothetical protein
MSSLWIVNPQKKFGTNFRTYTKEMPRSREINFKPSEPNLSN